MLSICVAVKNRSRVEVRGRELRLLPNFIRSLVEAAPVDDCELVVADWASNDWPLADWLSDAAAPVPVRVVDVDGDFSRGRGLNLAAGAARGDTLLFTDADSLIGPDVIALAMTYIDQGKAFFPIVFAFDGPEHQAGTWKHSGFGNCMMRRETFVAAGGWPEYFTWGREDDDFYARVGRVSEIVREEMPGFLHQWHPEDVLWKDQHGRHDPAQAEEIMQSRVCMKELADLLPPGRAVILVDEARFGTEEIDGRPAYPFPELDGAYAGPPTDGIAAIDELERLRSRGADFIAFAWMAFWWLSHYTELSRYLHDTFKIIRDDDLLKVFDLRAGPK